MSKRSPTQCQAWATASKRCSTSCMSKRSPTQMPSVGSANRHQEQATTSCDCSPTESTTNHQTLATSWTIGEGYTKHNDTKSTTGRTDSAPATSAKPEISLRPRQNRGRDAPPKPQTVYPFYRSEGLRCENLAPERAPPPCTTYSAAQSPRSMCKSALLCI
jgi:hypothetical protein